MSWLRMAKPKVDLRSWKEMYWDLANEYSELVDQKATASVLHGHGIQHWYDRSVQYMEAFDKKCLELRDYDRMRTLWLADIKRNAEQYREIESLKLQIAELNRHVEYWTSQYMKASGDQCGAFSATLFREKIADLEAKVRDVNAGNQRLVEENRRRKASNQNLSKENGELKKRLNNSGPQRVFDLEKENALLEGENRDLGTRILALTKKFTALEDAFEREVVRNSCRH